MTKLVFSSTSAGPQLLSHVHAVMPTPAQYAFTYLGSTLAEDGELDAEVTHRVQSGWKNWNGSVVRQENEREDQGEGVKNSGKTSADVRGRDMGVEEGT